MDTKQFAEFASAVVRQLPRNLDSVAAQRWIKDQGALANVLCKALGPTRTLYLAPAQKISGWVIGFDLEKHLQETKLINRCFSLGDEVVKGWLANPATYPEEYKRKVVFLWKSKWTSDGNADVAFLYWIDGRVLVGRHWLGNRWGGG